MALGSEVHAPAWRAAPSTCRSPRRCCCCPGAPSAGASIAVSDRHRRRRSTQPVPLGRKRVGSEARAPHAAPGHPVAVLSVALLSQSAAGGAAGAMQAPPAEVAGDQRPPARPMSVPCRCQCLATVSLATDSGARPVPLRPRIRASAPAGPLQRSYSSTAGSARDTHRAGASESDRYHRHRHCRCRCRCQRQCPPPPVHRLRHRSEWPSPSTCSDTRTLSSSCGVLFPAEPSSQRRGMRGGAGDRRAVRRARLRRARQERETGDLH